MCTTINPVEFFAAGPPAHVTPATVRIDCETCQEMTCGSCGHVGLDYRPFHLGPKYKALACCLACFAVEEV